MEFVLAAGRHDPDVSKKRSTHETTMSHVVLPAAENPQFWLARAANPAAAVERQLIHWMGSRSLRLQSSTFEETRKIC